MRTGKRHRIHWAHHLLAFASLFGFVSAWAQTTVGFSPSTVQLQPGETTIVAVTVSGIPTPGLAAFQMSLAFNPGVADILNPNEAFRGSITPFAPLGDNPFCSIVRGTATCPDPEWFLTSTGRTAEAVPDTIDNSAGFVQFGFGTRGAPTLPVGGGVVALIEVSGVNNGSVTVGLEDVILATADEPPVPIPASLASLTINVGTVANQAPTLDPIADQSVPQGQSASVTLSAQDPDGDAIALSATGLPAFATLTDNGDGTGQIDIAPGFTDIGTFPVVVTATDDGVPQESASQSFDIVVVDVNLPPVLAAIGNQSVAEGDTLTVPLSATDPDGDGLSFSASGLPGFGTLTDNGDGTGSLDFAPGFDDGGTFTITVTVTDDGTPALNDSETFVLTVTDANRAPVLAVIGNQTVAEGETLTVPLSASDPDGDGLTFSTSGLPSFATLTDNGDGTGSLDVAPGFDDGGTFTITVTVTDDGTPVLSDSETFDLTVTSTNRAPELAPIGNQSVAEGETLTVPLSATDPDGDALAFSATGLPAFSTLTDNGDGTGSLDFAPDFDDGGTFTITVTVTDDGTPVLSDSETFDLTVTSTNRAPELAPIGNQSVGEGETLTVPLTASDLDGDALAFSASGVPAFGTLTDNGDGTGSLDFAPGFDDGGTFTITVTVIDDGTPALDDSVTFDLVVTSTNQAPELDPIGNQTVAEGETLTVPLGANDPDGDGLTFSTSGLPSFGTLNDNGDGTGSLELAPGFDDGGTFTITVTVIDDGTPVLDDSETFDLTVAETNRAPVANAGDDVNVQAGTSVTLDGSDSFDPDADTITFAWGFLSLPAASALTDASLVNGTTPMPQFTPDVAGQYVVEVLVDDGDLSDTDSVIVNASSPPNVPPNANAGLDKMVETGLPVTLDGGASNDPDNGPDPLSFSWSFGAVPQGSTLTDADIVNSTAAVASFSPDVDGNYLVFLDVFDGADSDRDEVVVMSETANIPPTANAGPDLLVDIGAAAVLDGSGSVDPDLMPQPLAFSWTFASVPAGSTLTNSDIRDANLAVAAFTPDVAGTYLVRLDVSDGDQSDFDQAMVEAQQAGDPPTAPENVVGRAKLTRVNIVWAGSDTATEFVIFRRLDSETDFTELGRTAFRAFVDVLPSGASFGDYFVVAVNEFGESVPSDTVRVAPATRRR